MESIIQLPQREPRSPPLPMGGGASTQQRPTDDLEIGMLVFQCPATQSNIESGIDTDRRTFRRIRQLSVRVRCRACQSLHANALSHAFTISAVAVSR